MPARRIMLTIKQAAERMKAPRSFIENAIRRGALKTTGEGKETRVARIDVDHLEPYRPKPRQDRVEGPNITMEFTEEDALILSYCLTFTKGHGRLEAVEPARIRSLQVRFVAVGPPGKDEELREYERGSKMDPKQEPVRGDEPEEVRSPEEITPEEDITPDEDATLPDPPDVDKTRDMRHGGGTPLSED